jgi:hypothetical protein
MVQYYPTPWRLIGQLVWAILRGRRRSFRIDAMNAVVALRPPLKVIGQAEIRGPCVVTINHYARPGFQAWWLALAVSAALPIEVHWVITAAWRYPDRLRSGTITPVSRWVLRGIAAVYGFTSMPPMPPLPDEDNQRAMAVRRILHFARETDCPVIGLAPEGGDFAVPGELAELPIGVGRLMLHLTELGLTVLPVGAYEKEGRLCLNFGQVYHLEPPQMSSAKARDAWARQVVRTRIEELLAKS